MKQEVAITGRQASGADARALPLFICWLIWASLSAALWAIVLRLL